MFTDLKYIPEAWNKAFLSRSFRNQLIISILGLLAAAAYNFHYLRVWQSREGTQLNDYILNSLPPIDFSAPIFFIEYCTVLVVIIFTLPYPDRIVKGLQTIILIVFARTCCVYLLPLEPPRDMIVLNDPLAVVFLHSKTVFVTKDLFFSGHISVLATLALVAYGKPIRYLALIATFLVGVMIVWQHVHYSIDVLFAPLIAFISYRVVMFAHKESRYGLDLRSNENFIKASEAEMN